MDTDAGWGGGVLIYSHIELQGLVGNLLNSGGHSTSRPRKVRNVGVTSRTDGNNISTSGTHRCKPIN